MGRLAVCALYDRDGKHFCIQLTTTATGSAATMLDGAASMNALASVSRIGIMVGISAVTMNHICMIWITVMATGRVTAFSMVILAKFARNCFIQQGRCSDVALDANTSFTVGRCACLF